MFPGYMYYDSTMLVLVPGILLSLFAQWKVNSAMLEGKQQRNGRGISGSEAARSLLDTHGLQHVRIEPTQSGDLYDPTAHVVRLSQDVFYGNSLTALGVAAHEVGHAVQHKEAYAPLRFRTGFFPLANISNRLYFPIFLLGMLLGLPALTTLGIICFAALVIFQLVTLPLEYNASSRAMAMLSSAGYMYSNESGTVKKVLDAAALTYLAAAVSSILTLLRLVLLSRQRRR